MGGDGGVIPSNRRYLRGAGAAEKTGNVGSNNKGTAVDPKVKKEERARAMYTCAISNKPLTDAIVVCPFGLLYNKEAVVEALLKRKKTQDPRLDHIRGLKDLHDVRFHMIQSTSSDDPVPSCPVRGTELNGQIPAVVLVPGSSDVVNVVSERAVKEMGEEAIMGEYGPAENRIKLLPSNEELSEIKRIISTKKAAKKKREKKRKIDSEADKPDHKTQARKKGAALGQSKALKSLFTTPQDLSAKEKAENLFARI
mmetsp:Transcript_1622/g.2316  ORF Transcript_1622/g.2316 Transcript_1622/m.2316 type:complete len:254 (+) Transcript_1622:184-945(+)